jgi:hypothetical protein
MIEDWRSSGPLVAQGAGGRIVFDGQVVVIDRSASASFIIHGFTGPRIVPLWEIEGVRLRPVRRRSQGYLKLVRPGACGEAGAADPDTVLFEADEAAGFKALAKALEEAIADLREGVIVSNPDDGRESRRLMLAYSANLPEGARVLAIDKASPPDCAIDPIEQGRNDAGAPANMHDAREAFMARWGVASLEK